MNSTSPRIAIVWRGDREALRNAATRPAIKPSLQLVDMDCIVNVTYIHSVHAMTQWKIVTVAAI